MAEKFKEGIYGFIDNNLEILKKYLLPIVEKGKHLILADSPHGFAPYDTPTGGRSVTREDREKDLLYFNILVGAGYLKKKERINRGNVVYEFTPTKLGTEIAELLEEESRK